MREEEGDEGQPLDDEILNRIKDDLATRVGVGQRNIFVDTVGSNVLRLEIGSCTRCARRRGHGLNAG